eukprot:PhM_4_TR7883/c0_g1_i1/m.8951
MTSLSEQYEATCRALNLKPNSRIRKEFASGAYENPHNIDVSGNYLGGNGLQAFLIVIQNSPEMRVFRARDNGLSNDSIVALCRVLATHPSVLTVDLGENPISLMAAYALMDLGRKNTRIKSIVLDGTDIEEKVVKKITSLLSATQAAVVKCEGVARPTAYDDVMSTRDQTAKAVARSNKKETSIVDVEKQLREFLKTHKLERSLRRHGEADTWVVVPLLIVSTKYDFVSELRLVHEVIVPKLNKQLADRRAYIHPISMYSTPTGTVRDIRGAAPGNIHDHVYSIEHHVDPIIVHFVGDKHGWVPTTSLDAPWFDEDLAAHLRSSPLGVVTLELLRRAQKSRGTIPLFVVRAAATKLQIPESVLECFTDDVTRTHNDPEPSALRAVINPAGTAAYQYDLKVSNYKKYVDARAKALREAPSPCLVIDSYPAVYSHLEKHGVPMLSNLDTMCTHLEHRLSVIADEIIPPMPQDDEVEPWCAVALNQAERRNFFDVAPQHPTGHKSTLGKLELYTATPTSRNMFLIVMPPGAGASSIVASYVNRINKRTSCVVATHYVSSGYLSDEPRDLRTVLLSLCRQMLPDKKLPQHIHHEVRINEIKRYFRDTLKTASKELPEGKVLVLVVEGIDRINSAVTPNESLKIAETGLPGLQDTPFEDTGSEFPNKEGDALDWIPICLPRNVRLVATARVDSEIQKHLATRGQDSCEVLVPGQIGDIDIDTIVQDLLHKKNIQLTDSELTILRGKADARLPLYLTLAVSVLLSRYEAPTYESIASFLAALPGTLPELCNTIIDQIEADVGYDLAAAALTILAACEDNGISEMQWRDMLGEGFGVFPLRCEVATPILRRLEPVLSPSAPTAATSRLLQLRSVAFVEAILERYLPTEKDAAASEQRMVTFLKKIIEQPTPSPLFASAVQRLGTHMIRSRHWNSVLSYICTLQYIRTAFQERRGYCVYRDLMDCYNRVEAGKDTFATLEHYETTLFRLKEYINFLNQNFINLSQHPALTHQIAMMVTSSNGSVYRDAKEYYRSNPTLPYFTFVNKGRTRMHKDRVTGLKFSPSGLTFASTSRDRTARVCNIRGDGLHIISQILCPLNGLSFSATNKYVVLIAEDRLCATVDVTEGKIIARLSGHLANIRTAVMSPRGRYTFSGSDDRAAVVWDTESAKCLAMLPHNAYGNSPVAVVKAHPCEERAFFTACDRTVLGWELAATNDSCRTTFCQVAHTAMPVLDVQVLRDGAMLLTGCGPTHARRANESKVSLEFPESDHVVKLWGVPSTNNDSNNKGLSHLASFVVPEQLNAHLCGMHITANDSRLVLSFDTGAVLAYDVPKLSELEKNSDNDDAVVIVLPCHTFFTAHRLFGTYGENIKIVSSHDSRMVATVGTDMMLQVWDAASMQPVAHCVAEAQVTSVDWTPFPAPEGGDVIFGDVLGNVFVLRLNNMN